eukprot:c7679_g1_i1.p1 GENE.c7679_g1_i1~~c7679_g1_i1.p1  ORF type:complete len:103 (+),score=38.39 c7679_g1_i1:23-310(+)
MTEAKLKEQEKIKQWVSSHSISKSDESFDPESGQEKNVIEGIKIDPTLCIVCLDRPKETIFKKCGHMSVCEHCSKKLTKCPICQRKGKAMRVFLA